MAATATTSTYTPAFSRHPAGYNIYRTGEQAQAGPSTQLASPQAERSDGGWSRPYNSSYAPPPSSFHQQGPKGKGRSVDNGNGFAGGWEQQVSTRREAVDPFGRDLSAHGHSTFVERVPPAHRNGTQESYYEDDRDDRGRTATRDRGWSGSSKYLESIATLGGGGGHGGERHPHAFAAAAASSPQATGPAYTFPHMHVDIPGDEIGASPIPARRVQQQYGQGHQRQISGGRGSASGHGHPEYSSDRDRAADGGHVHAPGLVSPRDSFGSFWTFGRGSVRRGQQAQAQTHVADALGGGGGWRPNNETQQSRATGSSQQTAKVGALRDRSATLGGRVQVSTPAGVEASSAHHARPRANTAAQLSITTSAPALRPSPQPQHHAQPQSSRYLQQPVMDAGSSSEDEGTYSSSYQRHPYAQVMPPTGHSKHSRLAQPSPKRGSLLNINLNVPFLSSSRSLANLRDSANRLKASVSTPNLRQGANGSARGGNGSTPKTPSTAASSKWLSAETWCDALLFPRPRFRMRTAHVISPPGSPIREPQGPPYSAPPDPGMRTMKKGSLGRKESKEAFQQGSSRQNGQGSSAQSPPRSRPGVGSEALANSSLRPPRPKSFAQDDLALLASPVPSLNTVLRQNEDFNKEREQWKNAAAHSFQNKRSRSFSRSHTRAKAILAARLADDQSELVTSFDIIATTAFHGSQALKANVSTINSSSGVRSAGTSTGLDTMNTVSTHSRKSSKESGSANAAGRGHARKESWSKTALKTAKSTAAGAAGLCKFAEDLSPADEKFMTLDDAARQQQSGFNGRAAQKEASDGGMLLIAPNAAYQPHLTLPRVNGAATAAKSASPVPSSQSGESGVGIAVSTPSALNAPETQEEAFSFASHPYALPLQSQRPSPHVEAKQDLPRPSDYAGPHPSRLPEHAYHDAAGHDLNSRHRVPAAAAAAVAAGPPSAPHPFSAQSSRQHLALPPVYGKGRVVPPQKSMFAEVSTGTVREVMAEEFQYSPYSSRHPGSSGRNSDALGVEEALSVAFSRASADSALRDELRKRDGEEDTDNRRERGDSRDTSATASPTMRTDGQDTFVVPRHPYRTEPLPQIDEVSTNARESWAASSLLDDAGNTTSGSGTNSTTLAVPLSRVHALPLSAISARSNSYSTSYNSHSPGQVSLNSSPMASPRQFRKFDDEEDYSDLFYRPAQPVISPTAAGNSRVNSADVSRQTSRPGTSDSNRVVSPPALVRTDSGSALTNLQLQLSQSYGHVDGDRRLHRAHDGYNDRMRELEVVDEDMLPSAQSESSPPGAAVPLRVPSSRNQSTDPQHLIPEDVESERASSLLGRYETEEGTEIYYRLGEIPSLLTPDPVSRPQRSSAHGSYFGEHGDDHDQDATVKFEVNDPHNTRRDDDDVVLMDDSLTRPRRGLAPPTRSTAPLSAGPMSATTDGTGGTRASYLTTTSSTSRISNLSDFPSPPTQASLTPGRILDSYFGSPTPDTAADGRADPLAAANVRSLQREMDRERERDARRSRRTTFGPIEEDSDRDVYAQSDS